MDELQPLDATKPDSFDDPRATHRLIRLLTEHVIALQQRVKELESKEQGAVV